MFKLAVKSLLARKLRLALTSFAIVLGVSFIVSSFVIADSLRSTFDKLVADIEANTDLTVRTVQEFGNADDRPPISASVLPAVQGIDGVAAAQGHLLVQGLALIKADGEPVKRQGPPILGTNYGTDPELSQTIQIQGRPPQGPSEFNLDIDTAKDDDFEVGQTYTISSPAAGNRRFQLVGLVAFNSEDNDLVGAVLNVFDEQTAQEFLGRQGLYNEITVRVAEGADMREVQRDITEVLPQGTEVVDRAVKIQEGQEEFDEISQIFGTILLAFAIITVVVSAFIINNTFQIVVGQRIRELALLRALGATGSQVSRSVFLEALVIGGFSTAVGIAAGVLLSFGLRGLFSALGFSLPEGPLVVAPRTAVAAIVVGVGVTVLASLSPARKARRVPPIAALRDDFHLAGPGLRRRLIVGGVVTAAGAALLAFGLFGGLETAPLLIAISAGALAIFVGVNLLSPTVARPISLTLGAPIQFVYGTTGRLSRENSARNPRRTSSTAAALMIGLALVSMAAVVGDSIKRTFLDTLDNAVEADFFIRNEQGNFDPNSGIPPAYAEELAAQPEIDSVVPYRFTFQGGKVNGKVKDLNATDLALLPRHIDLDVQSGSIEDAGPNSVLVHKDSAKDNGLEVGDTIEMTFVDQQTETLTVAAIYEDSSILGNWVISLDTWNEHLPTRTADQFVTARIKEGVTLEQATAAVDRVTENYPQVKAENRVEFKKTQQKQLDSFLAVITAFLGFSLLIALLGIANTLALSVFERTRELGLLRAVGMTRRQMRRMVRWEAVVVAVFGAIMGVILGIIFGVAASSAVPSSVVKTISVPVGTIVIYVVVAGLAGLIAAWWPARRAGKLNVLNAISFE